MAIQRVADRRKLIPRREPYWHKVRRGCSLGFRKSTGDGDGHWIARYRDSGTVKQQYTALGDFSDRPDSDRFDAALFAAEKWFQHLDKGGPPVVLDVMTACLRYVNQVLHIKGAAAAADIRRRFNQYVFDDYTFARIDLTKLTPVHLDAWRKRLAATPSRSGSNRGACRSPSALNRDMTCLRAALNLAVTDGLVSTDFAWKAKLRPIPKADKQRNTVLSREQRKALIDALPPPLADLITAACLLPLRPGAVASLTVGNLDHHRQVLTIGKDKEGGGRKIALTPQAFTHLAKLCRDKLPNAFIFTQASGQRWTKDEWKAPFKAAVLAAGLPKDTVFYSVRHSLITDLAHQGIDLLTIAQISGTSLRMIEKHYGHLTEKQAVRALENLTI